jgi:putative transposase
MQQPKTHQLLFHSDQGTQYFAHWFTHYLKELKMTQSMSRRGNCWDNTVMERFFRRLKTERLNVLILINHSSAKSIINTYIRFYNDKILHSAIDYLTPSRKSKEMKKVAEKHSNNT